MSTLNIGLDQITCCHMSIIYDAFFGFNFKCSVITGQFGSNDKLRTESYRPQLSLLIMQLNRGRLDWNGENRKVVQPVAATFRVS